jgi:hypothetical protein
VLLQSHRETASRWHTVATSVPLRATSTYRLLVPTGRLGAWRYRTVVRVNATAKAAGSRAVSLRVVR